MTDTTTAQTTLQQLIAQLPQILTSLGVLIGVLVSWRNGRKVDGVQAQQSSIASAVEGVAAHVDGAATKSVEKIQSLLDERDRMREDKADAKQVAAVLASRVQQGIAPSAPAPEQTAATSLTNIDVNTRETASNTARVESKVEDLAKKQ